MPRVRSRPCRPAPPRGGALLVCAIGLLGLAGSTNADEASRIFNQRCTACHTFGKGVKVGPDLKGVTERRPRAWLLGFIRGSSRMIAAGDPVATSLFRQFQQVRMPDWSDLSEAQVTELLDWLAADGPNERSPDERSAEAAVAVDVELGRRLFHGEARFANAGMPCAACHAAGAGGGNLGPDLGRVYLEYQDRALTRSLRRPCVPRQPESSAPFFLQPLEAFALKAYLRHVAGDGEAR